MPVLVLVINKLVVVVFPLQILLWLFYYEDKTVSQWLLAYRCDLEKGDAYWHGKWPGNQLDAWHTTFPAWCCIEGGNALPFSKKQ